MRRFGKTGLLSALKLAAAACAAILAIAPRIASPAPQDQGLQPAASSSVAGQLNVAQIAKLLAAPAPSLTAAAPAASSSIIAKLEQLDPAQLAKLLTAARSSPTAGAPAPASTAAQPDASGFINLFTLPRPSSTGASPLLQPDPGNTPSQQAGQAPASASTGGQVDVTQLLNRLTHFGGTPASASSGGGLSIEQLARGLPLAASCTASGPDSINIEGVAIAQVPAGAAVRRASCYDPLGNNGTDDPEPMTATVGYVPSGHVADGRAFLAHFSADAACSRHGLGLFAALKSGIFGDSDDHFWRQPPSYDARRHLLRWALDCQGTDSTSSTDYEARLLTRDGYIGASFSDTNMPGASQEPRFEQLLAGISVNPGQGYQDFQPSGRTKAGPSLVALVTGGGATATLAHVLVVLHFYAIVLLVLVSALVILLALYRWIRKED